jgi:hypothetical protein
LLKIPGHRADRALALLHEESGAGFDPKVVAALERVVAPREGTPSCVAGLAAPVERAATRPVFKRA